jgi:hypothetical protein
MNRREAAAYVQMQGELRREGPITRAAVEAFERVRHLGSRSPLYREAYDRLAARVLARGGWVQIGGLRYRWSRGEAALERVVLGPAKLSTDNPVKV